jgi:diguanylate cyclase (GGDEF)-like protein
VTGDVLMPVLITFLIVSVILLVRAWAKGRLERPRALAADRAHQAPRAGAPEVPTPGMPVPATAEPELLAPALAEARTPSVATGPADGPTPGARPRDPLPFIDDEVAWDRRVADENARLVRYRRPVTIVRVELDGLDRLVGLLGDEAGDRMIRAMADTLRRLARDTDHLACLGNGSFAVLMPETPEDAAVRYVDRVSQACEPWLEAGPVAVSLAVGWASTTGEADLAGIQRLAAERMHLRRWQAARQAGSHTVRRPPAGDVSRPSVIGVELGATPRRSWETCRDPYCNHKEDHRRDRRR